MDNQPLVGDCVDSDDGLSPRLSDNVLPPSSPVMYVKSSSRCDTPPELFLCPSNEEVYEDSPRSTELATSVAAQIVARIFGESEGMKSTSIMLATAEMARSEGGEVTNMCGMRLRELEELLDPDNRDPVVTRDQCCVAVRRWLQGYVSHVLQYVGGTLQHHTPGITEPVYENRTPSSCGNGVSNEEVVELKHHNKVMQKTIENLQCQLMTNEIKFNCLKDEKLKLVNQVKILSITVNEFQEYKNENEFLEAEVSRLNSDVWTLNREVRVARNDKNGMKKYSEDLVVENNNLKLKVEQCMQNMNLVRNPINRKLAQTDHLQVEFDALQKEMWKTEEENNRIQLELQQSRELVAQLSKEKKQLEASGDHLQSLCEENCESAIFDITHLYEGDDFDEVPSLLAATSPQVGDSLFTELSSANEAETRSGVYRVLSTSCEFARANRATHTSTSETSDPELQTSREIANTAERVVVHEATQTAEPDSLKTEEKGTQTGVCFQQTSSLPCGFVGPIERYDQLDLEETTIVGTEDSNVLLDSVHNVSILSIFDDSALSAFLIETSSYEPRTHCDVDNIFNTLTDGDTTGRQLSRDMRDSADTRGRVTADDRNVAATSCDSGEIVGFSVESDGRRRDFYADRPNLRGNCEENLPEPLSTSSIADVDVDGSGDASCSPQSGTSRFGSTSGNIDGGTEEAKNADPPPRAARTNQGSLSKRLSSNRRRLNDARGTLDTEMSLLEIELHSLPNSARRQFLVVNKAVERALELAEEYGEVIQEDRVAKAVQSNTRCAGTMTTTFPLRRSASEPLLRDSTHRPRTSGRLIRLRALSTSSRISDVVVEIPVAPTPVAEVSPITRPRVNLRLRAVCCVIFVVCAVVLGAFIHGSHCCRRHRCRSCSMEVLVDLLRTFSWPPIVEGPRPI